VVVVGAVVVVASVVVVAGVVEVVPGLEEGVVGANSGSSEHATATRHIRRGRVTTWRRIRDQGKYLAGL
jgi:hypothetical protein